MKLNVKENLKSLEMYFCDVLGYSSYMETNNRKHPYYSKAMAKKFLILESPSVMHMLKNMDQASTIYPLQDIIDGKMTMPETVYKWYGTHPQAQHKPPRILVATFIYEGRKCYTDSGIKEVYEYHMNGHGAGEANELMLNYFLYCYDRKDWRFLDIPQETVDKIEEYLRSHGREIYDCR